MNGRTFLDSNVLIYGHDIDAGEKHETAKNALRELWAEHTGVLSAQVLQEFYVDVTRKIRTPLPREEARKVVEIYSVWCAEATTVEDILSASRTEEEAKISFWDALIISLAAKTGATRLLSEDLNPEQSISGVVIVNPFVDGPPTVERPV
ncbi:MAG: PIN domain-containing protein [Luteitalea sp.]|nr:PIN domain-containing protein [Luteitalea sp.]